MSKLTLPMISVAAGIPASRIDHWIKTASFVALDATSRATTRARDWSEADLVRLMLLVRMVNAGLPPEAGKAIGRIFIGESDRQFFILHAHAENLRTVGGRDAGTRFDSFVCDADEILEMISSPFDPLGIFVIDLAAVVRDVADVLEAIAAMPTETVDA